MPRVIKVDVQEMVPEFIQLSKRGKNNLVLATTMRAIEWLSERYQEMWMGAAEGAALQGLPFTIHSTQYQRTIKRRQMTPTTWEIYTDYTTKSGLSVTDILEHGHGLIDLKQGLLHGPKSRQGKNGRYNVVSFRHGTPGSDQFRSNPMPMSTYKQIRSIIKQAAAQKSGAASQIDSGSTYSSKSSVQPGHTTQWGASISKADTRGIRSKLISEKGKRVGEYTWKAGRYAGMVAMQQSTTHSLRSGYMTFRIVSEASDPMSWIVPEQPPWPVRQAIINTMAPIAEDILRTALQEDIK